MTEILFKKLSYQVVGAAMEVHRLLGPGFLESVYQTAMAHEFKLLQIPFEQQKRLTVRYKDMIVGNHSADFVVEGKIMVEIKIVSNLNSSHQAQALNYLAASAISLPFCLTSKPLLCNSAGWYVKKLRKNS